MTKIMLVEDDKSLREIYGVRLLAEGYEIISAGDGEEALAMAVKEKPDLILSDVMMPKISGFDMLDILRSTPETKDIKVIMMTALSSEDQRARGETLGANRYLVKSQVGIEDVVRTVHDLMADVPVAAAPTIQRFGLPQQSAAIINQPAPTEPVIAAPPVVPAVAPEATAQPVVAVEPQATTQPQPVVNTPAPIPEPAYVQSPEFKPPQPPEPPQPAFMPNLDTLIQAQVAAETAQPVAPVAPVINESTPIASPVTLPPVAPTELPQPTAPFSTAAPASLGDRIINPIAPTAPTQDMSALMNQELHDGSETTPTTAQ